MRKQPTQIQVTAPQNLVGTSELPLIQQGDNILIDARLLHQRLKVKTKFSTWIERRIEDYGFEREADYFPNLGNRSDGKAGKRPVEYLLTLDMAKELSMLENNEIGRAIRKAFIQAEKVARGISSMPAEKALFKGVPRKEMCGRKMLAYREAQVAAGFNPKSSGGSRTARYWMHFVKEDGRLWVTEEFMQHLYWQRRSFLNRATMLASQPVLPFTFYPQLAGEGGNHA